MRLTIALPSLISSRSRMDLLSLEAMSRHTTKSKFDLQLYTISDFWTSMGITYSTEIRLIFRYPNPLKKSRLHILWRLTSSHSRSRYELVKFTTIVMESLRLCWIYLNSLRLTKALRSMKVSKCEDVLYKSPPSVMMDRTFY